MLETIAPWPSVAARIHAVWPWLSVPAELLPEEHLPHTHPNLLWIAVPDAVGDADATLERFREWHMWLCHLERLAFVLQDGAEHPGRVPWEAPGLAAVFIVFCPFYR